MNCLFVDTVPLGMKVLFSSMGSPWIVLFFKDTLRRWIWIQLWSFHAWILHCNQ